MIKGIDFQKKSLDRFLTIWFVRRHVLDEVFPLLVMLTITCIYPVQNLESKSKVANYGIPNVKRKL